MLYTSSSYILVYDINIPYTYIRFYYYKPTALHSYTIYKKNPKPIYKI